MSDPLVHTVFTSQCCPDMMVLTLYPVGYRLAHIMEQSSRLTDTYISTNLFGDHPGQLSHLNRMLENILPIAGTKLQLAQ